MSRRDQRISPFLLHEATTTATQLKVIASYDIDRYNLCIVLREQLVFAPVLLSQLNIR